MPRQRPRPTTAQTAAELVEAEPEHLVEFVEHHPNPTPEAVVATGVTGIAPGELDPDDRHRLAAWIQARKDEQRDDARYRTLEYIERHEPTAQGDIIGAVTESSPITTDAVSWALSVLREGGYIAREDRATEPWRHEWVYRTADGI